MKAIVCSQCGETSNYSHKGMCLRCYNKWYYQHHKEKVFQNVKRWITNNLEHHRAVRREIARRRWARLTPEEKLKKTREQGKRRSPEEKERRRIQAKEYYERVKDTEKHKHTARHAKENRRAKECSVPNTLTRKQWEQIKKAYDYRCAYCGEKAKLTQDHIIPISKGGPHSAENIVPACFKCNRKKWDNPPPPSFIQKQIVFE